MADLPRLGFKDYKIFKEQFPPGSTDQRWGRTFARLTPIWIRDDDDGYANTQNNWTNLFLWQKLGPKIHHGDAYALGHIHDRLGPHDHADAVGEAVMREIKEHSRNLSEEMSEIKQEIERLSTKGDLRQVKELVRDKLESGTPEERMWKLERKIDIMSRKLDKIAEKLNVRDDYY